MKVLLFTDSDVFAGTESHMLDLAMGLRRERTEVLMGCPVPGALAARAAAVGLEVVPIAKRGHLDWRAALQLCKICRERGIDIIHAHNGRTALIAALAKVFSRKVRRVATQHFLMPRYASRPGLSGKISRIAHRWVDRRTDHLIAISDASRSASIARGEAAGDKITVIPNGIASAPRADLRSVACVRGELGISDATPLLVCAARLEPEKDVATLIDAMAIVVRDQPDVVCVIAGEGSLRAEFEQRITELNLQHAVRLLGFRADVMSIINAGDLFALPSLAEPFGLVLIEAMSLGKAVVATAAGGPLEIVEDGRTGMLVKPGNAREMAAAVSAILSCPEKRREMGQLGEKKYLAEFTVQRMAHETIAVYRRVLSQSREVPAPVQIVSPAGITE